MNYTKRQISPKIYGWYKCINSLFLGLNIGTIFTIYAPLEPSIYSLGGIVLAIAMLVIARLYPILMNISAFFTISLFVELVIVALVIYFLLYPYTYTTALFIYTGYQITFAFGNYLVRAETLILSDDRVLMRVDTLKQTGYLAGMVISWIFYKLQLYSGISDKSQQIYNIHYLLLVCEAVIIYLLVKSFEVKNDMN